LTVQLADWGVRGGYTAFECFQIWEMSGYRQLPYDGGFMSQPAWVRSAFLRFLQVKRWWHINNGLEDVPANIPRMGVGA